MNQLNAFILIYFPIIMACTPHKKNRSVIAKICQALKAPLGRSVHQASSSEKISMTDV
jgi:hypothetical protein